MWKMRGLVGLHQPTVYPDITADCYSKKDDPKSSLHWFSKKEGYCTEDYMKRIDSQLSTHSETEKDVEECLAKCDADQTCKSVEWI